jgi:hypothetical protein
LKTALERFQESYVPEPNTGCWLWFGVLTAAGYGQLRVDGKPYYAHRFSHETFVGPIPTQYQVDHLCRQRCCVNPDHLEAVPQRTNLLRGISPSAVNATKTTCLRGHPLEGENLRVYGGSRRCIECDRQRNAEWRASNRDRDRAAARARRGCRWVGKGGMQRTRAHCPQGHPYDELNTIRNKNGSRRCRACKRASDSIRRAGARTSREGARSQ